MMIFIQVIAGKLLVIYNSIMSLLSFLIKKQESVLGIDIGSSAMKIVQVRKKRGKVVLETYGELSLGPYAGIEVGRSTNLPPEKLAEALKDIIRESKASTHFCGVSLPLASSLISFLTVPQVPEKQLREVVSMEARKYIPVPLTEVLLDFSVIPKEESLQETAPGPTSTATPPPLPPLPPKETPKESSPSILSATGEETAAPASHASEELRRLGQEVLVVAIHNEYINNYQSIMTSAGLTPSFYEIEIFSAARSVLDSPAGINMIVDFGARMTKLYIVERGVLRASHIISRGSQDITLALSKTLSVSVVEAEHMKRTFGLEGGPEHKELKEIIVVNLDHIFYEANAVLMAYQKKSKKNIAKVILTGGGALLKGFLNIAKVGFQAEVIYANPFSRLESPAFLTDELAKAGPEFSVAIGAALRRLEEEE